MVGVLEPRSEWPMTQMSLGWASLKEGLHSRKSYYSVSEICSKQVDLWREGECMNSDCNRTEDDLSYFQDSELSFKVREDEEKSS